MTLSLPFFRKKWVSARVLQIKESTDAIRHIFILPDKPIKYRPGQGITVLLPLSGHRSEKERTFPIANAPNGNRILEICVSYVPGGMGSDYLFKHLEEGDTLNIRGPVGKFVLPEKITTDLVFITMGSALAPARSIIRHIFDNDIPRKKVHLIFGARNRSGLLCADEFMTLAASSGDFKYSFVLSQEPADAGAPNAKYVHEIYKEEYKQPRPDILFYVSGSPTMIEETEENLLALGYQRNQIVYEMNTSF